ncbi:MAG: hypothetical protein M3Q82_00225 [Actinomycetota bacterium]|nr:hypothetical protein [Actinomycetota bacterium]
MRGTRSATHHAVLVKLAHHGRRQQTTTILNGASFAGQLDDAEPEAEHKAACFSGNLPCKRVCGVEREYVELYASLVDTR